MTKLANEYWIHDGEEEFADGDIGDYNHEMIAESAILNEFIPNIPIESEYLISKDMLNQESVNDYDFINFLMKKYNIEENEAKLDIGCFHSSKICRSNKKLPS